MSGFPCVISAYVWRWTPALDTLPRRPSHVSRIDERFLLYGSLGRLLYQRHPPSLRKYNSYEDADRKVFKRLMKYQGSQLFRVRR